MAAVGVCDANAISQIENDANVVSVAINSKHNRRNTEPFQSGSLRSTISSDTATTWGSMFDFSSILFPVKKSKPDSRHSVRVGKDNSYSFPLDVNMISISPSTTSCSGDEDYDSSISSDSNDRTMSTADQSAANDMLNKKYNTMDQYIIPEGLFYRGSSNLSPDGNDPSCSRHFVDSKTDSIAAQWISMAAETLPERTGPTHLPNQQYYEGGVNCDATRIGFTSYRNTCEEQHQDYQIMYGEGFSGFMATPRYTNGNRNFQSGTQGVSMTRNDFDCIPRSEQHRNHSTSTNENHFSTHDEYTTIPQSNSSRESNQFNEGQSNPSFHQAAEGRRRDSSEQDEMSNGNMSDDEGHVNEHSSSDDNDDDDDDNESLSESIDVEEEERMREEAAFWKTAVDPKSGRTYYYNTKTLETQWRKPLCCASPSERRAAIKKERQTLAFFASMEQNILRTIQQQQPQSASGEPHRHHSMVVTSPTKKNEFVGQSAGPQHRRESEPPTSFQNPFKLVRTISSMEDSVLAALVQRVPSFRNTATTSKSSVIGNGTTFTSFSRRADMTIDAIVNDDTPDGSRNENSIDTVQRLTVREDSLPFGAIMDATRSQRRIGRDHNDDSSFSFSALMRMNSQHNSRFNMFEYIPEGDNEDNSESCSNHFESSEMSPTRGNKSLSRQSGFINLNKAQGRSRSAALNDSVDEDEDEDIIDDPNDQFSYRESLRRTNGSLALRVDLSDHTKEPITRENSLNLSEIADGRRVKRDPSVALRDTEYWGSYLSESALRGLSIDEGEAMLELASITDRMGGINSDTSDSSDNSVADSIDKTSIENVEPRLNSIVFDEKEGHGGISSDEQLRDTPELFADKPPRRDSSKASRPSMIRPTSLRNTPTAAILESITTKSNAMEKPSILRRNTCGTLYVGSTLSAPDKDATIKCVCAVYRAHILQSTLENDEIDHQFKVFDDLGSSFGEANPETLTLPTLEDVSIFYRDVFSRAQMESDCIIISLIYVERLIKVTDGALRPRISNWRSILFSCMVMASKVWDDLSMWNADFSHTCPAGVEFPLSRINELEIAVLSSLQYKVKVPASEYAKYYFLLRSMLIKSGLGSEDLKAINPLDVEGAKQLQHISSQYQASVALLSDHRKTSMGRSKTTGGTHEIQGQFSNDGSAYSSSSNSSTPLTSPTCDKQQRSKVGLEHMVQL
jgi:hypothetical protein